MLEILVNGLVFVVIPVTLVVLVEKHLREERLWIEEMAKGIQKDHYDAGN